MSDSLILDPELEGLLREVAADPRSRLLRVPRQPIPPGLFDRDPRVTSMAAGLTAAERHLLRAHRTELAFLLRQAAVIVLTADPRSDTWLDAFAGEESLLDEREWFARCAIATSCADGLPVEDCTQLVECAREQALPGSAVRLAAASMRLSPSDEARIYAGFDLQLNRDPASAFRAYSAVLNSVPSRDIEAYALENLALASSCLGRGGQAVEASRKASRLCGPRVEPILNFLAHAVAYGNSRDLLEAAELVADRVGEGSSTLARYVSQIAKQQAEGAWTSSPERSESVRNVRARLGAVARKVVDAIL